MLTLQFYTTYTHLGVLTLQAYTIYTHLGVKPAALKAPCIQVLCRPLQVIPPAEGPKGPGQVVSVGTYLEAGVLEAMVGEQPQVWEF